MGACCGSTRCNLPPVLPTPLAKPHLPPPPALPQPFLANSTASWWNKRWDIAAGNTLRAVVFDPICERRLVADRKVAPARPGPLLQLLASCASFGTSGLIHEGIYWSVWVGVLFELCICVWCVCCVAAPWRCVALRWAASNGCSSVASEDLSHIALFAWQVHDRKHYRGHLDVLLPSTGMHGVAWLGRSILHLGGRQAWQMQCLLASVGCLQQRGCARAPAGAAHRG